MPLTYTDALMLLSERTPQTIKDVEDVYGATLLKEVAPDHEFVKYLGIGLDGIIILANSKANMRRSVFKFAKPKRNSLTKFEKMARQVKEILKIRNEGTIQESPPTERFLRSAKLQMDIADFVKRNSRAAELGRVPEVYAVGKIPKLYIEMEYVAGADLLDWCRVENSEHIRVKIIRDIAEFIYLSMHNRNIVHSDLKPSNFLITGSKENYRIGLIDFGGAKDLSDSFKVTLEGEIRHSFPYTSPHQMTDYANRNPKDDIHGLGIIFYYCMAQKTPEQLLLETPTAKNYTEMFPLSGLGSPALQRIFNRCTGTGLKYPTLMAMAEDLDEKILNCIPKDKKVFGMDKDKIEKIMSIWVDYLNKEK